MTRRTARHAIRNRLLTSMTATVALGLVMTAIVFGVAAVTIRTQAAETSTMVELDDAAHVLQMSLFTQETFVFDYALSGRSEAIDEFDAATAAETEANARLRTIAADLPEVLAAADAANHAAVAWRESFAEPFLRSDRSQGTGAGQSIVAGSEELFRTAEARLQALVSALDDRRAEATARIDSTIPRLATVIVPFGLVVTVLLGMLGVWLTRSISGPLGRLDQTVEALVAGEAVSFRAERDDELGALADVLERLRVDAGDRYGVARREGENAAIFNQLAELTSFARDETDLVAAAGRAIRRLVPTSAGDILLANPSQNRLSVGAAWGDGSPEAGSLIDVDRIDRCPGIRRSAPFVAPDLADDMAVRCLAHPASGGSVACIPMLALGKIVGVMHLESPDAGALGPEAVRLAARVAENVGLAMANARLMTTMEGQAMTDPLTGLRNTRFFDPYLGQELEAARRDQQPLSVLMIDIDHFKAFNDAHGHPAGDEALRAFARVVGGSIRASDVAARYGGEEFVVALRHASLEDARRIAEQLRTSIEQMVVELGPGRYARITASFGVATTSANVADPKSLVALADAALYQAKEAGRNRVVVAPTADVAVLVKAGQRHRGRIAVRRIQPVDRTAG